MLRLRSKRGMVKDWRERVKRGLTIVNGKVLTDERGEFHHSPKVVLPCRLLRDREDLPCPRAQRAFLGDMAVGPGPLYKRVAPAYEQTCPLPRQARCAPGTGWVYNFGTIK